MKDDCVKAGWIGRREFLVKSGIFAGGAVLTVTALRSAASAAAFEDVTIVVGSDSALAKAGGSLITESSAGKIIVINEGAGKFAAFSARCTHKGSLVEYDAAAKKLKCPKHGSEFSESTGDVARGPAEDALKKYDAAFEGGSVTVKVP